MPSKTTVQKECPRCYGKGKLSNQKVVSCHRCDGAGWHGTFFGETICGTCSGNGVTTVTSHRKCQACAGQGHLI